MSFKRHYMKSMILFNLHMIIDAWFFGAPSLYFSWSLTPPKKTTPQWDSWFGQDTCEFANFLLSLDPPAAGYFSWNCGTCQLTDTWQMNEQDDQIQIKGLPTAILKVEKASWAFWWQDTSLPISIFTNNWIKSQPKRLRISFTEDELVTKA